LKKLIIATRKSPLALAQTGLAAAHLERMLRVKAELLKIVTTGDRQAEWSLEQRGGKGLFTGELEQALLRGEADVAIHSTKDLPGGMTPGLVVAGYLPRADPHDVLVIRQGLTVPRTIATGSPRRRLQASRLFPSVAFTEIRGNVDTRLKKIAEQGVADATILAAAGLARLGIAGWPGLEFRPIDFFRMVPAVGQGAVAVQCRTESADKLARVFDRTTGRAVALERAFQNALGGGCQTAFGTYAGPDYLHFFHEQTGVRIFPLAKTDLVDPVAAATRILRALGLK
jgi:hydroxymethylbilane synthase